MYNRQEINYLLSNMYKNLYKFGLDKTCLKDKER